MLNAVRHGISRAKKGRSSQVAKNSLYFYLIQIFDIPLSLITIPYLVRALSADGFGLAAFAISLANYFNLLIDYGFGYSATRKIARHREDEEEVNAIVFSVFGAKAALTGISLLAMLLLILAIPQISQHKTVFFAAALIPLGNLFYPLWAFQGMEQVRTIALLTAGGKILSTGMIFWLIQSPSDAVTYVAILGGVQLALGILGSVAAIRQFNLKPFLPSLADTIAEIKGGWNLFLTTTSANLYANSGAFLLGLFASNAAVGYYSGAEKIARTTLVAINPIIQATYPALNRIARESPRQALDAASKILVLIGVISATASLTLFVFADQIINLILGGGYEPSVPLLKILSPIPFLFAISATLGLQVMLPLRKDAAFMKIILAVAALNLLLVTALSHAHGATGTAIAMSLTELISAGLLVLAFRTVRKKIN